MLRLPVFAGLGSDTLFSNTVSEQASRDATSNEAQSLLQACHKTFLEEVAAQDVESTSCGVDAEDFSKVEDLLRPSKSYHQNAAVQHAYLCLVQLLRYMRLETSFSSELVGSSGFCAGLLPAVAAATSSTMLQYLCRAQECYRVAVKIGVASEIFRRKMSPAETDQPWSLIVDGLSIDEAQKLLSKHNDQEGSSPLFVSARNSDDCVTLSGEAVALQRATKSILPEHCRVRRTNVFSIYHNRQLLSEISDKVLQDVKDGKFSFPKVSDLICPIFRTTDGSTIAPGETYPTEYLLESVLAMIFLEAVDWISVQQNILSSAEQAIAGKDTVTVQNFGPGYGALIYRKNLPKAIQVVDVSTSPQPATTWSANDIAIVGMGLDVPEAESDPNRLWQNIMNGINTCSKIPTDRFIIEDYHQDDKSKLGNPNRSMATQYGSFLENPFLFDNSFFGISPREARSMDPQQRLLLQTAQRALEDAGYVGNATKTFATSSFGCYIGAATGDYADNLKEEMDVYWVPGVLRSFLSGRISYAYGWGGPALTVDTACSSSIVAIWQGARALQMGDCNACIAGGVNVVTSPDMYIGLDRAHFLSPTGQCKSFDDPVDGYCRADGVACLVMKRMSDALAENDRILGVIKGVEVNQSGTAHSITHPHTPTQEILFKSVWRKNGIDPLSVSVVEAHGTGTGAGDPSELHGITNSLCEGRNARNPLNVGSIKANVGHSEAASGAVSLIKLLLMFKNKTIPPQTLFNKANSNLADLAKKGIVINREAIPWEVRKGQPRLAMLNNFGGSGSNGALIVQEFEQANDLELESEQCAYTFGCSTKSEESLLQMRDQIVTYLENQKDKVSIKDVCYTSTARRQIYSHRLSTTASSVEELITNLKKANVVQAPTQKVENGGLTSVFLFSGQGSQYRGMGKELMSNFPAFEATVNKCDALLTKWGLASCLDVIQAEPESETSPNEQQAFQTTVFVIEVALAQLLISFGITPRAVAGHSLGEYAALVIAGVMDLPSALKLVAHRAHLIATKCSLNETTMLAAGLPADDVTEILEEQNFQDLCISCDNSPDDCVVGGPTDSLNRLKKHLEESMNVRSKVLDLPIAFHTSSLEPIMKPLAEFAQGLKLSPPSIPVASNVLGRVVAAGEDVFQADYFSTHCRQTVQFNKSMEDLISIDEDVTKGSWIEVGPHPIILPMLHKRLSGTKASLVSTLRRGTHPTLSLSQMMSQLYLKTNGVHWRKPFESLRKQPALLSLPGVPFMQQEFHVQYPRDYVTEKEQMMQTPGEHEHEGTSYEFLSKVVTDPGANPDGHAVFETPIRALANYISGHTVGGYALCPASVYCELALSAVDFMEKPGMIHKLSNIAIPKSLVYREDMLSQKDINIVVRISIKTVDVVRGLRNFTISSFDSLNDPENVQVHCRGIIESRMEAEVQSKHLKLVGLLDQKQAHYANVNRDVIQNFSGPTLYEKIFTNTVQYSDMYRSIQFIKIDASANEALATCKLPPSRATGDFGADPIMVDALIHVAGFMANLFTVNGEFWICNGIKSTTVLRTIASEDRVFSVHCNNFNVAGGKTILSDAQAFDSKGVCAVIKSMQFERVKMSDRAAAFKILAQRSKVEELGDEDNHNFEFDEASQPSTATSSSPERSGASTPTSMTSSTADSLPSKPKEEEKEASGKDIISDIQDIVVEICGTEKSKVQPDTLAETLGIDSLMVHEMRDKLSELMNMDITVADLTKCNTIIDIAALVGYKDHNEHSPSSHPDATKEKPSNAKVVADEPPKFHLTPSMRNSICRLLRLDEPLQLTQSAPPATLIPSASLPHPLFMIHPGSGLTAEYNRMSNLHRAVYSIHNPSFVEPGTWSNVGAMAAEYARLISATHKGPFLLGGWSFGGLLAFEAARLLADTYGPHNVVGVVLVDTAPPMADVDMSLPQNVIDAAVGQGRSSEKRDATEMHQAIRELVKQNYRASGLMVRAYSSNGLQLDKRSLQSLPKISIVRATEAFEVPGAEQTDHPWLNHTHDNQLAVRGWGAIVGKEKVTMREVPSNHFDMFSSNNIEATSEALADACAELQGSFGRSEI